MESIGYQKQFLKGSKMRNKVKIAIKGRMYEIGRRESWLRDMAKKGYILKKMGTAFATFEIGEPIDTEYRIKMAYQTGNRFEEYGWERVAAIDDQVVYRCKDVNNSKELPIYDLEYEPLFKRAKRNELLSILVYPFNFLIFFFSMFFNSEYWIVSSFTFVFISIMFSSIVLVPIKSYKEFKRIRAVKQETTVNHHKDWRETEKYRRLPLWVFMGVTAISVILTFAMYSPEKVYALDDEYSNDKQIEVLRLYDLDDTASRVDNKEDNYVSFSSNIFASTRYKLEEGVEYSSSNPYLAVDYYELRVNFLSRLLQLDYTRYWRRHSDNTYELSSIYFDYVKVYEVSSSKDIFIRNDNIVIYIEYSGDKTAEQLIEEIEKIYADDWQGGKKKS